MNTEEILAIVGRKEPLFEVDFLAHKLEISKRLSGSKVLVVGAAGTIGKSVCKHLVHFNLKDLHAVDINENNLVELVREIRSSGEPKCDFKTFTIDVGSDDFEPFYKMFGPYDYIFNLSALKHVRSEKDPFSLSRMIQVNIINSVKLQKLASQYFAKKYFCVSTDKAANPANLMGATKRAMEIFLLKEDHKTEISFSRFANVAFSDGSLLHGFVKRMEKGQPLSAPRDIERYFVTQEEAGLLCLMSCIMGCDREIFFPKLVSGKDEISFDAVAINFLKFYGYSPAMFESEREARAFNLHNGSKGKWPCYFFDSDTTGEKQLEEFFSSDEVLDMESFHNIGMIKANAENSGDISFEYFLSQFQLWRSSSEMAKQQIVELLKSVVPTFNHLDTGKSLEQKM